MYDRRTVLAGTFGAVAALAGCQSASDSGTPSGTPPATATPAQNIDYGDWFADTDNFDGTADMRGQSSVTVSVGASGNGESFAFDPPAIRVDPGTTVVWEWTGNGGEHNVVANDDSFRSGDPVSGNNTYERAFDTEGIRLYFCSPHDSLGMRGAVVVGDPSGGADGGGGQTDYGFEAASFDAYWYSLYNMSTNIAMSGNGVPFPLNEQMEQLQSERMPAMLQNSEVDQPPIANPNLSLASFTEGDPSFTQQPVLSDDRRGVH